MPITAIASAMPHVAVIDPPAAMPVHPPPIHASALRYPDGCDFSDDGRLGWAGVGARSAWLYPGFYVAIIACAVLGFAVLVVRLCGLIRHEAR